MLITEVLRAQREFLTKMYGTLPNRVLMNEEKALIFKDELRDLNKYDNFSTPETQFIIHGMRLVIDPWVAGIEVAYAR